MQQLVKTGTTYSPALQKQLAKQQENIQAYKQRQASTSPGYIKPAQKTTEEEKVDIITQEKSPAPKASSTKMSIMQTSPLAGSQSTMQKLQNPFSSGQFYNPRDTGRSVTPTQVVPETSYGQIIKSSFKQKGGGAIEMGSSSPISSLLTIPEQKIAAKTTTIASQTQRRLDIEAWGANELKLQRQGAISDAAKKQELANAQSAMNKAFQKAQAKVNSGELTVSEANELLRGARASINQNLNANVQRKIKEQGVSAEQKYNEQIAVAETRAKREFYSEQARQTQGLQAVKSARDMIAIGVVTGYAGSALSTAIPATKVAVNTAGLLIGSGTLAYSGYKTYKSEAYKYAPKETASVFISNIAAGSAGALIGGSFGAKQGYKDFQPERKVEVVSSVATEFDRPLVKPSGDKGIYGITGERTTIYKVTETPKVGKPTTYFQESINPYKGGAAVRKTSEINQAKNYVQVSSVEYGQAGKTTRIKGSSSFTVIPGEKLMLSKGTSTTPGQTATDFIMGSKGKVSIAASKEAGTADYNSITFAQQLPYRGTTIKSKGPAIDIFGVFKSGTKAQVPLSRQTFENPIAVTSPKTSIRGKASPINPIGNFVPSASLQQPKSGLAYSPIFSSSGVVFSTKQRPAPSGLFKGGLNVKFNDNIVGPTTGTKQATFQTLTTRQTQRTIQQPIQQPIQTPIGNPISPSPSPPKTPPPIVPPPFLGPPTMMFGGDMGTGYSRRKRRGKRKYQYTPTLIGLYLGGTAKKSKGLSRRTFSGLEIRRPQRQSKGKGFLRGGNSIF